MDRERALTPLAIVALALLTERDMHPYEMFTTMVERREDLVVKLRAGSLYHTVNRLAEDRSVTAVGIERDGNRPERTTYAISDTGRERLRRTVAHMLAEPAEEYPQFPVAIAEAHNLDRASVIELLRGRLRRVEERAATLAAGHTQALAYAPAAVLLDVDYLAAMRSAEAQWLRGVIARLENETLDWKVQTHGE